MRILHVSPYFAPAFGYGGPPRSILALCRAQQAAGLDVQVLTTTANGDNPLPALPQGTTYDGVPVKYFPVRGPALLFWAPELGAALEAAAGGADVIHTHGLFNVPAWQAHRASRRHERPLVISARGMLEPEARAHHAFRKRAAWTLFDRRAVEDAALIHTTSSRETASVRATRPQAKIAEIPNAIDVNPDGVTAADRQAVRSRLGIGAGERIVLFLGRLHPIKRLDLLARAFAAIARNDQDVRLVIAGGGDADVRECVERHLGDAAARVIWPGPVEGRERDALLAETATLVLCSNSENFGMSVAEALAFGVPPVVTRTCPWQALEESGAGFWVAQTAEDIARGVRAVLDDPAAARAMGARGRQLAADRFHPAAIGAEWASEYEALVRR